MNVSKVAIVRSLDIVVVLGGKKVQKIRTYELSEVISYISGNRMTLHSSKMDNTSNTKDFSLITIGSSFFMATCTKKKVSLFMWSGFPHICYKFIDVLFFFFFLFYLFFFFFFFSFSFSFSF